MKILVISKIDSNAIDALGRIGTVVYRPATGREEALSLVGDADVLVCRTDLKIDQNVFQAGPKLKIVASPTVGTDHIDLECARQRGVQVINTPAATTASVAEHTIGLLLALLRHIPQADRNMRQGRWDKHAFVGVELQDKIVGIIGFGRIGSAVHERLRAFGCTILVHDPYVPPREGVRFVGLDELLSRSDIVTLHVPLTPQTTDLLDSKRLALMKKTAYLINASRGKVIDIDALHEALVEGRLAGAALDVFPTEPLGDHPLLKLDNVLVTPHIAGSTKEGMARAGRMLVESVRRLSTVI